MFPSRLHRIAPIRTAWALSSLVALSLAACGDPRPARQPSVLLITVDTLRADHLGPYASLAPPSRPLPQTPQIDLLAATGTVFDNAVAPMPLTLPSHFSIFSSLYPREHGVMNNGMALPEAISVLPEMLMEQGYATGGFASVTLLDQASGAARGFDTFVNPRKPRERPGEVAVEATLDWLTEIPTDKSFFGWVHLFDPHLPYGPPAGFLDSVDPQLAKRWPVLDWPQLRDIARENDGNVPRQIYEHALALYRAEVEYIDAQIGRLLQGLEALGRRNDTLIVLTADHGEAFENGVFFEHADSLFDGAIRIPLILSHPGSDSGWPTAGARVPEQVSSIDIAPTILDALGLEIPAGFAGRPLQNAASFGDRYVLVQHPFVQQDRAESHPHVNRVIRTVDGRPVVEILVENERVGLVGTDWKLLRTDQVSSLYRRSVDPAETRDLAQQEEPMRQELETRLEQLLEKHPLQVIEPAKINDELRETLEALGYLD